MSIKSTKQEAPVSSTDFPKLMTSVKGNVVLFSKAKVGTLLYCEIYPHLIGHFNTEWDMNDFSHNASSITLSNES